MLESSICNLIDSNDNRMNFIMAFRTEALGYVLHVNKMLLILHIVQQTTGKDNLPLSVCQSMGSAVSLA